MNNVVIASQTSIAREFLVNREGAKVSVANDFLSLLAELENQNNLEDIFKELELDRANDTQQAMELLAEQYAINPIYLENILVDNQNWPKNQKEITQTGVNPLSPIDLVGNSNQLNLVEEPEVINATLLKPLEIKGFQDRKLQADLAKAPNQITLSFSEKQDDALGSQRMIEANQFQSSLQEAQKLVQSNKTQMTSEPLNIELLQKEVDAGKYNQLVVPANLFSQTNSSQPGEFEIELNSQFTPINVEDVLKQVKSGLVQNMADKENSFIIKLNPASLGEITVKLVQKGQQAALSIVTAKTETAKLLNNQIAVLSEALRPYNTEIQSVISQPVSEEQSLLDNYHNLMDQGQQSFNRENHNSFQEKSQPALYYDQEFFEGSANLPTETKLIAKGLDCYI